MSAAEDMHAAIGVLSRYGWFAERAQRIREALIGMARLRNYSPGQALYLHGDRPDGIFGLVDGALEISIPRADGTDLTVHRADPGFWIGDSALISRQTRLVTVRAVADARIMFLPQPGLRRLALADPGFYGDLYALSHLNLSTVLQLLGTLATMPSEARVARRLLQQTDQRPATTEVRLSHAKLAELVALSTATLQRVLRRLEVAGLIELDYGCIRIADRQGLNRLCSTQDSDVTN